MGKVKLEKLKEGHFDVRPTLAGFQQDMNTLLPEALLERGLAAQAAAAVVGGRPYESLQGMAQALGRDILDKCLILLSGGPAAELWAAEPGPGPVTGAGTTGGGEETGEEVSYVDSSVTGVDEEGGHSAFINLNCCSREQLLCVHMLGTVVVDRLLQERCCRGQFLSWDDFLDRWGGGEVQTCIGLTPPGGRD